MSSLPQPVWRSAPTALLRPMTPLSLDGVMALEEAVYPFPWTRGNSVDSLAAGYVAWTLNGPEGPLLAYCVAMRGAGEMHLLNITVAPALRRQGHARRLLGELSGVCRSEGIDSLWLEVRVGNVDARETYRRLGFATVGMRKGYYPAPAGTREDALVMRIGIDRGGADDALD